MKPLFSIVVPVHNTEQYLDDCVEALLKQTFKDFEIIFVENGSTDNSLDKLKAYEQQYENIKVLVSDIANSGAARNFAFDYLNGEYVLFLDSDDYIENTTLEECAFHVAENPDVIVFGAKTLHEGTNKINTGQYSSKSFSKIFNKKKMFKYHAVCWNKVYNIEFLKKNNIKFSTLLYVEDQIFFVKIMMLAQKVKVICKDFYVYRKNRPNALTCRKVKTGDYPLQNLILVRDFLNSIDVDKDLEKMILKKYLLKVISWSTRIAQEEKADYLEKLKNILEEFKKDKNYSWLKFYKPDIKYSDFRQKFEYLKLKFLVNFVG